jgi:putative alpha-1,2-mannosidase
VFAALGLYPVVGTDRYILTTPVFERARLNLPDGRLVIASEGSGDYLAAVRLDGEPLERAELRHQDLVGGHTLTFVRSDTPTAWGAW